LTRNELLLDFLSGRLPADYVPSSGEPFAKARFMTKFASAGRKCGTAPLLSPAELEQVESPECSMVGAAGADEAGRIALLLDANRKLGVAEMFELAEDCFRHGDNGERRAVLRCMSLLQEPERYVELAAQACRSSVQTVFEALACENPFPAATMPDLLFNQMVLKAVFTEVALDRVVGLAARVTPELSRMAADYAQERRAAGRKVPADIDKLVAQG
jgi:hypothetical protein